MLVKIPTDVWTQLQTEEENEGQVEPIRTIKGEGNRERAGNNMEDFTPRDTTKQNRK